MLLEAMALAASGDLLAARSVVERAISAKHADPSMYTLCADLSLQLRDPAGAVRCADIALAAEPANAYARAMRGEALVRLGTADKGIEELDAATAAAPGEAELWRRSGRVLLGLGKSKEALQRYTKVLELQPRDADALLAAAEIHLQLGELDQARTIALSLVGSPAQEARGQYVLGHIALKQQKPEDAVIAFARATRLDRASNPHTARKGINAIMIAISVSMLIVSSSGSVVHRVRHQGRRGVKPRAGVERVRREADADRADRSCRG